jgi:5-methyltetrahydrofolate--homocysteine methyltransferase
MSFDLEKLKQSVIDGNAVSALDLTRQALEEHVPHNLILNVGLIEAMSEVGKQFEAGTFYIPEMLIAARAMQACMDVLKPLLSVTDARPIATAVIGTVKGDLHDIGKNLVRMMLAGAGFNVVDLGTDVTPEKFVQAIQDHGAKLVGLSALLTTTMISMGGIIKAIEQAGLRNQVKIIIGGAPITEEYARQIGADGYASDASRAVNVAKSLITGL